jgi:SSS family solute:Na+ symporter
MIVVSVILAFYMPGSIIMRATAMFMGLCAAAFLPMLTYGLFSKRPSSFPAKISLLAGALSWFLWTAFIHAKESEPLGICNLIFGKVALMDPTWQTVDPLVITIPVSTLVLLMGIFIDKRTEKGNPSLEA